MKTATTPPSAAFVNIDELIPYARNSRTHSEEQIARLAAGMMEFGYTNSILADEKGIVAGHGRVMAAQKLYAAGKQLHFPSGELIPVGMLPVVDVAGWTDAQRKAYIIADNQMAALAGWDLSMLKIEVDDLRLQGFDIELTGFTEAELDKMMPPIEAEDSEKDPDEVPVVPDVAYSKLGQIWCCGPHKIMCGSSTSKADWDALMQGELADIQVCDPPYGVDYSSELAGKIKNDNLKDEEFYKFLLDFYTCSFGVMKAGAAMYVAHADSEGANFRGALKKLGFLLKSCLMWVKSSLVLGRGDFHYRHEPILYSIKPGGARRWYGGRKNTTLQDFGDTPIFQKTEDGRYAIQYGDAILYVNADAVVEEAPSTLLHFDKPKRSPMHPTTKPVRLWEKLIGFNARPGDVIIDGFGGSGTTMIAADRLGLSARLMELDERFSDVICVRYFQFTGRIPVDAKTGESFPKEVIDRLTEKFAQA